MTSFNITGLSTVAQTLNATESGFIGTGAALVRGSDTAVEVRSDASLLTLGAISSGGLTVTLAGDSSLRVGATGTIVSSGWFAVNIGSTDGHRVVVNAGLISGYAGGVIHGSFSPTPATAAITLINTGTIIGETGEGVHFSVEGGVSPGTSYLENSGTIVGTNGVSFGGRDFGGQVTFQNSGLIEGRRGMGIVESTFFGSTTTKIVNSGRVVSGEIGGDFIAILLSSNTVSTVINTGEIVGHVNLGGGPDLYRGTGGLVVGTVRGEEGADTLIGGDEADELDGGDDNDLLLGRGGDDFLSGYTGNDRMLGGSGDDEMNGGTDNDTLNGGEGDDTLEGDAGNDLLLGLAGTDFLLGATGNDTLDGGAGDDQLYGGADRDVLRGRDGVDVIDGGLGRDVTEGGPGADQFIFNNVLDSTPDANRDVILDFETGIDTINLVNVIPGVFVFRGTLGFTSTGGPELRLQETPDGSTIIHLDTDGNGTSDMQIRTAGVTGLTAGDFEL